MDIAYTLMFSTWQETARDDFSVSQIRWVLYQLLAEPRDIALS